MLQRSDERGITIIETTVILSVLFILAGIMAPIVSESVTTARAVKAKNDASMIAIGLINLQKDLGGDALAFGHGGVAAAPMQAFGLGAAGMAAVVPATAPSPSRLPDVLASAGEAPQTEEAQTGVSQASLLPVVGLLVRPGTPAEAIGTSAMSAERRKWREMAAESLDDHLRTNRRGYRMRRPGEAGGWNGPYLSAELKGDPWGNQYLVNSQWLDGGSTAAGSDGVPRRAVFVVSAGSNGVIETPFEQPILDARAYGDDIVVRIQ